MRWAAVLLFLFTINHVNGTLSGQVESGLSYVIEQDSSECTIINLTVDVGFSSENEIEQGINQFLAFALLQETELLSREDVQNLLHECRQDISPWAHIAINPGETTFTFRVPYDKEELVERVLTLANQVASHATLSPIALEHARNEVIDMLSSQSNNDIKDQIMSLIQLLFTFTQNQLKTFYHSHYCLENMHLNVTGPLEEPFVEKLVLDVFGPLSKHIEYLPVKQSLETTGDSVVVDGKIIMNQPSWSETRWWGTLIATACGVIAAGCYFAGIFFPPLVALALIPLIGGVYFYVDPYLKDPYVIEEKRIEDLQKGFRNAYTNHRAGHTLTPYERRNLFIQENSIAANRFPDQLKLFVIADLVDIYRIHDQIFGEFLYPEELVELQKIKDEFVLQRNDVKNAKRSLDNELNTYLESHQILRDQKLDAARQRYESHPAVQLMRQITFEWEEFIAELWDEYESDLISKDVLDYMIEDLNVYYEDLLSDIELLIGVQEAKDVLEWEQQQILREYESAVIMVKTTVNYDQRMSIIEAGKWTLYTHFNNVLINYVFTMPVNDPHFPDTLDLR